MARLNKLDCEYTLEEAKKDVDTNDITTHPFFKKHFAGADSQPSTASPSRQVYAIQDKEQPHVSHYITHILPDHDHIGHAVEIETQHYGRTKHIGGGRGMTVHEAMDNAVHTYTHPVKVKPLTESLVGKKPATASKLFAEEMETRLDEISKKLTGKYVELAIRDRDKHIEDATHARASADALQNVRTGTNYVADDKKRDLRGLLGDMERKAHNKKYKRERGIVHALDRLTKEDLNEEQLKEVEDHDYAEGKYAHLVGRTMHSDTGPVKVAHVLDPFAFAPYQATDDEGRTYNIHKDGTLHRAPKFQRGYKDIKEDEGLDEVEAPANFWNAGMAKMNPIQVSQKQPAEPGQFKATLTKSPKRLADQDSSLEGKPRAVRDETEATAVSRGPKAIELTGDWHADVPDHSFDPKLDSETEYYPLFSQFKSLGAYPSGPARAWEETEINESDNDFDYSYRTHPVFTKNFGRNHPAIESSSKHVHHVLKHGDTEHHVRIQHSNDGKSYSAEVYSDAHGQRRSGWDVGKTSHEAFDKAHKAYKENYKMPEYMKEDELNELSKKTLSKYVDVAADKLAGHAYLAGGGSGLDKEGKTKEFRKAVNRLKGIKLANKKLSEDSASLMATATKDEKKAAEQDKKKPSEFKKLHDKHETEVKAKMKELGEEALDEGLFDPAKQPLLSLWDEHARRADAHGSGSRNEILKRIEDHVAKKHGQEGLKKMKLHTDLTNALKHSLSPDKGHLQAILGNMRSRCAMGV